MDIRTVTRKVTKRMRNGRPPVYGRSLSPLGSGGGVGSGGGYWEKTGDDIFYDGGNVGIGTQSPSEKFTINDGNILIERSSGIGTIYLNGVSGSARYASIGKAYDTPYELKIVASASGGTAAPINFEIRENLSGLYIASNGNVGIGTTSPSQKLTVSGNILASGEVTAFSDRRLKDNLEHIPSALDKINKLTGYTYDKDGKRQAGLIAQEVQEVLPEAVSDGKYLSLNDAAVTALLVEAINELEAKLDERTT